MEKSNRNVRWSLVHLVLFGLIVAAAAWAEFPQPWFSAFVVALTISLLWWPVKWLTEEFWDPWDIARNVTWWKQICWFLAALLAIATVALAYFVADANVQRTRAVKAETKSPTTENMRRQKEAKKGAPKKRTVPHL